MAEQPPVDITQDDKLIAALCYVFSPLVPIIIMFLDDKKERPFIKAHYMLALVTGIALMVLTFILAAIPVLGCISPFLWLVMLYYAYKAFQGEIFEVPVISGFLK